MAAKQNVLGCSSHRGHYASEIRPARRNKALYCRALNSLRQSERGGGGAGVENAQARHTLYERGRNALLAELEAIRPPPAARMSIAGKIGCTAETLRRTGAES